VSVDSKTYVETMLKYPVKFKFTGLDGFHETITAALRADERYVEEQLELDRAYHEKQLEALLADEVTDYDEDDLERYRDWLKTEVKVAEIEDFVAYQAAPLREQIEMMERSRPTRITGRRLEFLEVYKMPEPWVVREACLEGLDEGALLKEYPIEEIYSAAYEEGVPADDVWFLCPGMGCHEPQTKESVGEHYYCGKCGCEWLPGDLHEKDVFERFCDELGLTPWPFRKPKSDIELITDVINSVEGVEFGDDSGILTPDEWKARGEQCPGGAVLVVEYQQYSQCAKYFSLDVCFAYDLPYDTQEQMTKALDDAGFWMEGRTRQASFIYRNPVSSQIDPRTNERTEVNDE